MSPKRRARIIIWARRAVQTACLCLFVILLHAVHVKEGAPPSPWLKLFFDLDPLVAIGTWLAAHSLPSFPWLALITLVATVLLGRVFCGWVCPLGTVHNAASWLRKYVQRRPSSCVTGTVHPPKSPFKGGLAEDTSSDNWTRWQRGKYYLLAALLLMAVFGAHWIGVFDPMSLLFRATATAIYPGAQYAVEDAATDVYQSDPHLGPLHLKSVTEPVYRFTRDSVFGRKGQAFDGGTLILLLFAGVVLLNFYKSRFWCRYVCPLGGLLGLCSPRPVMRLVNTPGCTGCGLCAKQCPAAANPDKPGDWRPTECFGCWSCVAACNRGVIDFKFRSPLPAPSRRRLPGVQPPTRRRLPAVQPPTSAKLDLSKRALLSAGVGGLTGLVAFRLSPQSQGRSFNPALIRPPGARDERAFLQRCLQCGVCMKACPTNGLQPTLFEAGLEGIWTPMLVPRIGYCEYNCNLCGQVCPTQAIQPLTLEEKRSVKLGLATVDTTRCLPYAYNRECMICEEHCPTPKKAIYFMTQELKTRDGKTITLKQPYVDPDLCTGCGICENVCVFKDQAAIRVTSANETRHSGNRPVLPGLPGSDSAPVESPTESASAPYAQKQNNP